MEHTCKYCEQPKTEAQMAIRGGKPSKMCLECKENRAGLGAGAPAKKKAKAAVVRRKPKAAETLEIEVPGGGHGFKAALTEEDALLITQENAGTEADNIVLTRHEVRQLFETFGEWAVEA